MRTLQRRRYRRSGMYGTLASEQVSIQNGTTVVTPTPRKATQAESDFDKEYEEFIAKQRKLKAERLAAEEDAKEAAAVEAIKEETAEEPQESPVTAGPDIDVTEKTEEDVVTETVEETVDEAAEPVAVETKKSRKKKAATAE